MYISIHSILGWASSHLHELLYQCTAGVMEVQLALIAAFRSSALLGFVYYLPLHKGSDNFHGVKGLGGLLVNQEHKKKLHFYAI